MYTLRIIFGNGTQSNECLGKHYNYVNYDFAPEEFKSILTSDINGKETVWHGAGDIYGFIVSDSGARIRPLHSGQRAYIMLGGKTIDSLT